MPLDRPVPPGVPLRRRPRSALARHGRALGALLVVAVALLLLVRSCADDELDPTAGRTPPVVVSVVDGDTVRIDLGSHVETVRLIGIDTPETKHPTEPVGCFGPEASARTEELLVPGTEVTVERDAEERDRYGRLLAYVVRRADGAFVNLQLAREGFADALSIAPNTSHAAEIGAAVREAREQGRGLWGACPGAVPSGP
jgi:micrococcal nuclease